MRLLEAWHGTLASGKAAVRVFVWEGFILIHLGTWQTYIFTNNLSNTSESVRSSHWTTRQATNLRRYNPTLPQIRASSNVVKDLDPRSYYNARYMARYRMPK